MARPTKLLPEIEKDFWEGREGIVHRRTMRNTYFMCRALEVLIADGMEKYSFLCGMKDGEFRLRKTLLSELGRNAKKEILLRDARYICDGKLNTVDTLNYLRIARQVHGSCD